LNGGGGMGLLKAVFYGKGHKRTKRKTRLLKFKKSKKKKLDSKIPKLKTRRVESIYN